MKKEGQKYFLAFGRIYFRRTYEKQKTNQQGFSQLQKGALKFEEKFGKIIIR